MLLNLLELLPTLDRALVLVQAEVAERLAAPPGHAAYGVPSVKAAWYGEVRRAGNVGRRVFWPEPNVDSGLVSLVRRPPPPGDRRATFAVVDAAFATRRKGLRAALAPLGGQPGRGRGAAARRRDRPDDPRRAAVGHRLRPAGRHAIRCSRDGRSSRRAPAKVNVHLGRRSAAAGRLPRAADGVPRGLAVRHGHRAAGGRARASRSTGVDADVPCPPTGATSSGRPPSCWPTHAGVPRRRRRSRSPSPSRPPPAWPVAAPTPRPLSSPSTRCGAPAPRAPTSTRWPRGSAATSRSACSAASRSAPAAASSSRRCWPGRRSHWVLGIAGDGLSTPAVYAELDRLRAAGTVPDGGGLGVRRTRCIAALRSGPPSALAGGPRQRPAGAGPGAAARAAAGRCARRPTPARSAPLVSGSGPDGRGAGAGRAGRGPAGGRAGRRGRLPHRAGRARPRARRAAGSAEASAPAAGRGRRPGRAAGPGAPGRCRPG